ncbi:MAG: SPFH domain-containing protein [Candidatus Staskawiczbacteria bacterium]|nr:SPFH domain-containing protein [Candidatus Staskawiczbacteria bacterium]
MAVVGVFLYLVWRYWLSLKVIGPDEVGVLLRFGKPQSVHRSGSVVVKWVPFKWDEHYPWELVRIPTKMFQLSYEGSQDHKIWSSDNQRLLVETSVYMRFPYADDPALIRMVKSSVPTTEEGLKKWMEEEVIRVVRHVMANRTYKVGIGGSDSEAIAREANELFSRADGLLVRSGVYGTDVKSADEGKGEVTLKVEQVLLTPELQSKLESVEVAELEATAAKGTARRNAEEVGGQILGIVARSHGMSISELEADLKAHPEKRGMSTKKGGYAETFVYAQDQTKRDRAGDAGELTDLRIGNADGSAMTGELPAFAAAALLLGKGGRGGGGKQGNRKKGFGRKADRDEDEETGDSDGDPYEKSAKDFFVKHGVYPVWDPLHRTPVGDGTKPKQ